MGSQGIPTDPAAAREVGLAQWPAPDACNRFFIKSKVGRLKGEGGGGSTLTLSNQLKLNKSRLC